MKLATDCLTACFVFIMFWLFLGLALADYIPPMKAFKISAAAWAAWMCALQLILVSKENP
jgi:hypothetical protein